MLKYDLNLREYLRIIKRRKLVILFTVIVMGIFSFISAILGKPVPIYKTFATVKIEKSTSYLGLNTFQSLSGATNAMETQTYVMKSYLRPGVDSQEDGPDSRGSLPRGSKAK